MPWSIPARIALASLLTDLDVSHGCSRWDGRLLDPAAAGADGRLLTIDASVEAGS